MSTRIYYIEKYDGSPQDEWGDPPPLHRETWVERLIVRLIERWSR